MRGAATKGAKLLLDEAPECKTLDSDDFIAPGATYQSDTEEEQGEEKSGSGIASRRNGDSQYYEPLP